MQSGQTPEDQQDEARQRLRDAVRQIPVDRRLHEKVRRAMKQQPFNLWLHMRWAGALALICIAITLAPNWLRQSRPPDIQAIVSGIEVRFQLGLGDHLECALQMSNTPIARNPVSGQLELRSVAEGWLGAGEQVVDIHQCVYRGQRLTHMVASGRSGRISIQFARKPVSLEIQQARIAGYSVTTLGGSIFVVSRRGLSEDMAMMQMILPRIGEINWGASTGRQVIESEVVSAAIQTLDPHEAR